MPVTFETLGGGATTLMVPVSCARSGACSGRLSVAMTRNGKAPLHGMVVVAAVSVLLGLSPGLMEVGTSSTSPGAPQAPGRPPGTVM